MGQHRRDPDMSGWAGDVELEKVNMKKCWFVSVLLTVLVASCAPTPTPAPAPTPEDIVSPAVVALDQYFQMVNSARTQDDFARPWDMLSNEAQCGSRYQCDLTRFQSKWWEWKVNYKLYNCGSNLVTAEEMRYLRDGSQPVTPVASQFWQYQLIKTEEGFMIEKSSLKQGVDAECVLAVDQSSNP